MIHSFKIKNYHSVNEPITVDLSVDMKAPQTHKYRNGVLDTRLSLVEVFIGPNSSGKTTALRALVLLKAIFTDTFEERLILRRCYKPFAGNSKEPTELSVTFEIAKVVYEYSLALFEGRIISERLDTKTKMNVRYTKKNVFSRQWHNSQKRYEFKISGGHLTVPFHKMKNRDLENSSLLAISSRFGDDFAIKFAEYWQNVETNIPLDSHRFFSYGFEAYQALENLKNEREGIVELLARHDKSIKDIDTKKGRITHEHNGQKFDLDVIDESSGTRQFFVLTEKLHKVLKTGGVAVIDEFDAYLHPYMLNELVEQFFDPEINQSGAQLIMSTHSHQILSIIDKYHVIIVEKIDNATTIKRLDEIDGVRSDDNYYAKYMAGKYGGIPEID